MSVRRLLGVVVLLTAAGGVAIGAPELVAVAAGLGSAVAASGAWSWRGRGLHVRVASLPRATAGRDVVIRLDIANEGSRRSLPVLGVVRVSAGDGGAFTADVRIPRLAAGTTHPTEVVLAVPRRGKFEVDLLAADPTGLATRALPLRGTAVLWVHPVMHRLRSAPPASTDSGDGTIASGGLQGGQAFQYLREYVPGDDVRLIHWRVTAAHGMDRGVAWPFVRHQVVVDEPELVIVLDTNGASYLVDGFEEAVRAVASLVGAGLARGGQVRLMLGVPALGTPATAAPVDRIGALDLLAAVVPSGGASIGEPGSELTAGTVAVVITGAAPSSGPATAVATLRDHGIDPRLLIRLGLADRSPGGSGAPNDPGDVLWFATSRELAAHWDWSALPRG